MISLSAVEEEDGPRGRGSGGEHSRVWHAAAGEQGAVQQSEAEGRGVGCRQAAGAERQSAYLSARYGTYDRYQKLGSC